MSLMVVLIFAAFAASLAVILMCAAVLHDLPFHHRRISELRLRLAGHQPMLGGGPLCHVVISIPPRCRAKEVDYQSALM
jgi:hypothetical protein